VTGLTATVHQEHGPRVVAAPTVAHEMDALEPLEPHELGLHHGILACADPAVGVAEGREYGGPIV
jgi:hypothetical protein